MYNWISHRFSVICRNTFTNKTAGRSREREDLGTLFFYSLLKKRCRTATRKLSVRVCRCRYRATLHSSTSQPIKAESRLRDLFFMKAGTPRVVCRFAKCVSSVKLCNEILFSSHRKLFNLFKLFKSNALKSRIIFSERLTVVTNVIQELFSVRSIKLLRRMNFCCTCESAIAWIFLIHRWLPSILFYCKRMR